VPEALPPAGSGSPAVAIPTDTGEILLLPAELWEAIDVGIGAGARHDDPAEAAQYFAKAFATALHDRGLFLGSRARSNSKESVLVDTYALALDGKHSAERMLGAIAALVKGGAPDAPDAMQPPLLDDFSTGILTLAGRRPPGERHRIQTAMLRLRAIAALLDGCGDIDAMPPFDDQLVQFFKGELPAAEAPATTPPEAA
jgi:hypothetical protein